MPAVTCSVFEIVRKSRRIDQKLFGNAAADHAGTADAKLFGHHHARAIAGRDTGGPHSARSGADDEKIDVLVSHSCPVLPRRGRFAPASDLVTALFHLVAKTPENLLRQPIRPGLSLFEALVHHDRLIAKKLLTDRRAIKPDD